MNHILYLSVHRAFAPDLVLGLWSLWVAKRISDHRPMICTKSPPQGGLSIF
jgi:hypothetical protein